MNIPFINKNKGGNKNIFTLFDNKQLNTNYKISTISFLKMFESILKKNNRNNFNSNSKNIYIKGSETKKYYEQLKIK